MVTVQRLSDKINRPNFDFMLGILMDITAGCSPDQLMELSDRLHGRRRQMALPDQRYDNDLIVH